MTVTQPHFDFTEYPFDQQAIGIRLTTMNYDANQLQMFPVGLLCSYGPNGDCTFSSNPIWRWMDDDRPRGHSSDDPITVKRFCTIYYDPRPIVPAFPAYTVYVFNLERYGSGTVARLLLPITLLLVIAGISFWQDRAERLNMAVTILLAISALYIVILGNIPMVGYLTNVDKFIFTVSVSKLPRPDLLTLPLTRPKLSMPLFLVFPHRCSSC
jgi:hypothetical protein